MPGIAFYVCVLVLFERLSELIIAKRNTKRLLEKGAVEYGRNHYKYFVLLHTGWLIACLYTSFTVNTPNWLFLGIFLLFQIARIWVMTSLGKYWTTRVISIESVPLIKRGPYKWVSHPNYIVVAVELITLPLALGQVWIAIIASLLNIPLTWHRISVEEQAIATRKKLPDAT